ncbi:hypothetical protein DL96DRAFT_1821195 [Flagelloscypha sp. PMI_526]|nr:hypothetical protein DL96DRAFT_1821195 [Flagelloscypha sp. PMI_526]
MSPFPPDVVGEILPISTAIRCATVSHVFLPIARKRIYHRVLITGKNIKPFVSDASHLLCFTRIVRVVNFPALGSYYLRSSEFDSFLESIAYHAVLVKLDYDGRTDESTRELILRVSKLPSLEWLGVNLELGSEFIGDSSLKLLSTPKLRRLSLLLYRNASSFVPPRDKDLVPLPPLVKLSLRAVMSESHAVDGFQRWTSSWMNLELLRELTISSPRLTFPSIPERNQVELLRCENGYNFDSFMLQFPALKQLKHLIMSAVPREAVQLVEELSSPIRFTIIFVISFKSLRNESRLWLDLAEIINRREDRRHFVLRVSLDDGSTHMDLAIGWVRTNGFPLDTLPMQIRHFVSGNLFSFMEGLPTII